MDYAIIRVGGKQYRVREGETLLVDRVRTDEGGTFSPDVLLGDGGAVTATVVAHERGPKVRIGKYKRRTGYKRHAGFRAALTRIEISLGGSGRAAAKKKPAEHAPKPKTAAPEAAAPAVEEAAATPVEAAETHEHEHEHVKGMPKGYEEMTVAQISDGAKGWNRPMLEAALEYEEANAARKGAIAALTAALKAKEES
ncbi:MAG TPA: 50S ribosomal protein L21 [Gaiellaceae bacterium]|nr:50S ribosomal protein L21 [Gaiellaceae bacterium]